MTSPYTLGLEERVRALEEALEEFATQDGCTCGHPACKRCERTREARAALEAARYPALAGRTK